MIELELEPSHSKPPCSSLSRRLPLGSPWDTSSLLCAFQLSSDIRQGRCSCLFCRVNWDSERSWNWHVHTQLRAELKLTPLHRSHLALRSEPGGFPGKQNPLRTCLGWHGRAQLIQESLKEGTCFHYCCLAGNLCHLERRPRDQCAGWIVAPKKPERAEFPAMPRQLAGVCTYIFLTIKQTSRLAEHCRENDITAEF